MSTSLSLRRHPSSASSKGTKKRKSSDASQTNVKETTTTTAVIQTTQMSEGSRPSSMRRSHPTAASSPGTSPDVVDSVRWQPVRIETVSEKRKSDPQQLRAASLRCHLPDVSTSDHIHHLSVTSSPTELTEVDLTAVEEVPVLQRLPSVTAATMRPKKPHRVCKVL